MHHRVPVSNHVSLHRFSLMQDAFINDLFLAHVIQLGSHINTQSHIIGNAIFAFHRLKYRI